MMYEISKYINKVQVNGSDHS